MGAAYVGGVQCVRLASAVSRRAAPGGRCACCDGGSGGRVACSLCGGRGGLAWQPPLPGVEGPPRVRRVTRCPACGGAGRQRCLNCLGTGHAT